MADTTSLTSFLDDVASAIKYKKGDNTAIPAANFDTEIRNLPSQGTYEEKSVTITQNGTQNVVPDSGYDALSRVSITTAVPEKQLQTKSSTITDNGTIELHPDTGYDGFDQVNLTINVSGGGDVPVKLFNSIAAMNSSSGNQLGDLALVYANETRNMIATDQFSKVMFPQTVINVNREMYGNPQFRAVNGSNYFNAQGDLTRNRFYMNFYLSSGQVRVNYTSSDGYTYTRTTLTGPSGVVSGDIVNFGFDIEFTHPDWWGNGQLGYFFQMVNKHFDGLFQYKNIVTTDYLSLDMSQTTSGSNVVYDTTRITKSTIDNILTKVGNLSTQASSVRGVITANADFSVYHLYCNKYTSYLDDPSRFSTEKPDAIYYLADTEKWYAITTAGSQYTNGLFEYTVSTDVATELTPTIETVRSNNAVEITDKYIVASIYSGNSYPNVAFYESATGSQTSFYYLESKFYDYNGYDYAASQLTVNAANQLLPGVIAYGPKGVITGDNTIYDNVPRQQIFNKMYGLSPSATPDKRGDIPYNKIAYGDGHEEGYIHHIKLGTLADHDGLLAIKTNDPSVSTGTITVDGNFAVERDTSVSGKYIFKRLSDNTELSNFTLSNSSYPSVFTYGDYGIINNYSYTYGGSASSANVKYDLYAYDMANNRQVVNNTWTLSAALSDTQYGGHCAPYCYPYKDFMLCIGAMHTSSSYNSDNAYVVAGGKMFASEGMPINLKFPRIAYASSITFNILFTNRDTVLVFYKYANDTTVTVKEYSVTTRALTNTFTYTANDHNIPSTGQYSMSGGGGSGRSQQSI